MFPSVLIGEDYHTAVELPERVKPECIVTNNTGIAFEAYKKGIPRVVGPYLNTINFFNLLCLKENFNDSGAFISNEISKMQMRGIKKPGHFDLFYSIYHPIVLMTSRQCLFQQVIGCGKAAMDNTCITDGARTASITILRTTSFVIEKSKGNYNTIYNETNFQNTDIITDLPGFYAGFMIDLRDIKTGTKTELDKSGVIRLLKMCCMEIRMQKRKLNGISIRQLMGNIKRGFD